MGANSLFCVFLSAGVCLSVGFGHSASPRSSYGISITVPKGKEGHTPQEVGKGHTVYFLKYTAFHESGSTSLYAFTSLYALPEYSSLITKWPFELGHNLPLGCGS